MSEIPLMSPERRNSYLSIAERRKYYNKTQERTRKPEIIDVELENQETNNKIVTVSILDTLQTNEIPVSKKPALKESNRIAVEKKNPSNSQKALVNFSSNEKQKKFQTSRQSVIQSQFEFGQKLNLKKPPSRVQDSQDEKIGRNRDKIKSDQLNADNSTNKIVQTYSTQSTKLLRVNKNVWVTTLAPEIYGEQNDGVEHKNKTDVMNLAEFIAFNRTQEVANAFSGSINSTSFVDNQVSENSGPTKAPMLQAIRLTPSPLPLSYENVSAKRDAAEDEEIKRLASSIQNVYNQEILRLNSTRKSVKVPLSVLRSFGRNPKENSTKTIATTEFDSIDSSTPVPLTTQPDLKPSNAISFEEPSVLLKASNKTKTESTLKSQLSFAGEHAENATIPSEAFVHSNPTLFNSKVDNNGTKFNSTDVTTPSGTLVPEASFNRSDENPKTQIKESDSSSPNPEKKFSTISTKEVNAFVSSTPSLKLPNTNKEYPLTIELNENNKRVLSEMFQTPKINEASKIKIPITRFVQYSLIIISLYPPLFPGITGQDGSLVLLRSHYASTLILFVQQETKNQFRSFRYFYKRFIQVLRIFFFFFYASQTYWSKLICGQRFLKSPFNFQTANRLFLFCSLEKSKIKTRFTPENLIL